MKRQFPKYELLLRLYPAAYRNEYGRQMIQTVDDMLADAHSATERRLVWARVILDLPLSITKSQLQYAGSVFHNETPNYVKYIGVLAGLFVLPFFLALVANGLDKVIYNHSLNGSWLWRMPTIGLWVLWLPALALSLTFVSYVMYMLESMGKRKRSGLFGLLDVIHAWPVVIPGIIALGILFMLAFHDSTHCWLQNPVYFITRFHQTVQCTQRDLFGG
jgi:hypothetical protein